MPVGTHSSRRRLHPDHKTDKTEEGCRITPVMPAPCASVGYGHGPRWSASKHLRQGDATNRSGPAQTPSTVDPVRTIEKAFPVFSSTLCRVGLAGSAPRDWLDAVTHTPHNSRTFFWGRRPTRRLPQGHGYLNPMACGQPNWWPCGRGCLLQQVRSVLGMAWGDSHIDLRVTESGADALKCIHEGRGNHVLS